MHLNEIQVGLLTPIKLTVDFGRHFMLRQSSKFWALAVMVLKGKVGDVHAPPTLNLCPAFPPTVADDDLVMRIKAVA
jgi:hypothetical protein